MKRWLLFTFLSIGTMGSITHGCTLSVKQQMKYETLMIYVESKDSIKIQGFLDEMLVLTNKIVSAEHDYSSHIFTIKYNEHITEETILYIFRKYFVQYKILE